MTNIKQLLRLILMGASAAFVVLAIVGAIQFKADKILGNVKASDEGSISQLNHGWTYEVKGGKPVPISLPKNLNLQLHIKEITLRNKLPEKMILGGGIRVRFMMSAVKIYIDGELVKSYGEITDVNHFTYNSASTTLFVPLKPDQYGKDIVIELSSLYSTELGMLTPPKIGSQRDFILHDFLNNGVNVFFLMMLVMFSIILLVFYAVFQSLHNKHLELVAFSIFTLLIAVICNSQNTLLWEIFNYYDTLPGFNAWFYFIEDGFLPILGYLILSMVTPKELSKKAYIFMGIHGGIYIGGAILQLMWILSINYLRPLFMLITLISYLVLFCTLKPWESKDEAKYYQLAIFCVMGANIADYLRYLLGFLPLTQQIVVWLNLELPFLFLLPIGSIVYMILLSYALVFITKSDLEDIKDKAQRDLLTGLYNRSTMEALVSDYMESHKDLAGFMVIDIDYFKTINDTQGHLHGDRVLKEVAQQLEIYFSNNDIVARLGGDEFGIFSPHLSDEHKLREKAALVVAVLGTIEVSPQKEKLSASVGFATYDGNSEYDELYDRADQAMYVMKRNRVTY